MPESLYLHEEILLLALRDREGTVAHGTQYHYALGGALLAELLLTHRAEIETEGKKHFLQLTDRTPFDDPLLDEALVKLQTASRRAQLRHWVSRFARISNLKNRIAQELCRKKILRESEERVLFIFRAKMYPELDPGPERRIMKRLERAIFTDSANVDPRTVVLLALADRADVLKVNFDKVELKVRRRRIEQVVSGELTGRATRQAIKAMQAAVAASVAASAAAAASSA